MSIVDDDDDERDDGAIGCTRSDGICSIECVVVSAFRKNEVTELSKLMSDEDDDDEDEDDDDEYDEDDDVEDGPGVDTSG
jgi:hypothetical protein